MKLINVLLSIFIVGNALLYTIYISVQLNTVKLFIFNFNLLITYLLMNLNKLLKIILLCKKMILKKTRFRNLSYKFCEHLIIFTLPHIKQCYHKIIGIYLESKCLSIVIFHF